MTETETPAPISTAPASDLIRDTVECLSHAPTPALSESLHHIYHVSRSRPVLLRVLSEVWGVDGGVVRYGTGRRIARDLGVDRRSVHRYLTQIERDPILGPSIAWRRQP